MADQIFELAQATETMNYSQKEDSLKRSFIDEFLNSATLTKEDIGGLAAVAFGWGVGGAAGLLLQERGKILNSALETDRKLSRVPFFVEFMTSTNDQFLAQPKENRIATTLGVASAAPAKFRENIPYGSLNRIANAIDVSLPELKNAMVVDGKSLITERNIFQETGAFLRTRPLMVAGALIGSVISATAYHKYLADHLKPRI